jgi:hypothetical protein
VATVFSVVSSSAESARRRFGASFRFGLKIMNYLVSVTGFFPSLGSDYAQASPLPGDPIQPLFVKENEKENFF